METSSSVSQLFFSLPFAAPTLSVDNVVSSPTGSFNVLTGTLTFAPALSAGTPLSVCAALGVSGSPPAFDETFLCIDTSQLDCIPTVSQWGLIVMTLLLLTAGTVMFGRWRQPAAA